MELAGQYKPRPLEGQRHQLPHWDKLMKPINHRRLPVRDGPRTKGGEGTVCGGRSIQKVMYLEDGQDVVATIAGLNQDSRDGISGTNIR